jgi:hypothetical protein
MQKWLSLHVSIGPAYHPIHSSLYLFSLLFLLILCLSLLSCPSIFLWAHLICFLLHSLSYLMMLSVAIIMQHQMMRCFKNNWYQGMWYEVNMLNVTYYSAWHFLERNKEDYLLRISSLWAEIWPWQLRNMKQQCILCITNVELHVE